EIDRCILADRRMRATAGLDPGDALGCKRTGAHQIFGVPLRINIVGDRRDLIVAAQALAQRVHQRGLARADRTADADAERTVCTHDFCVPYRDRRVKPGDDELWVTTGTAGCTAFRGACWRCRREPPRHRSDRAAWC